MCELPNDRERCDALETLPPDLKSTYERILRRVDDMKPPFQSLVQRTLRWLVVARGGLTISALKEALSIQEGIPRLDNDAITHEYDIQRSCGSLVRKSASGQELELAHFTVKEFLLEIDRDSRYAVYRVDVEGSEVELGKVCLTYLTLQDFNSTHSWSREAQLKRLEDYKFRHYAVKNWLSHANCRLGDPGLLTLIQKLLDPIKPGTFMTWIQDHQMIVGRTPSSGEDQLHQELYAAVATDTPLHYASAFALPAICKWLLDCGCEIDHMSRFGTPLNHALVGPVSLIEYSDEYGSHGLWEQRDNENILQVLGILLEAGADPRSESYEGCTLLYYACGDQDSALRLLPNGAVENIDEDDEAIWLERAMEEAAIEEELLEEGLSGSSRRVWRKEAKATSAFIQATDEF